MEGKTMKKITILMLLSMIVSVLLTGCGGGQQKTGFLSDYSKLQKEGAGLIYVSKSFDKYPGIIVDKVEVHLYEGEKAKGDLTAEEIKDLTGYMHAKAVEAIKKAGKKVAYKPDSGVARLRIAITDLDASSAVTVVPQASLLGAGLGGAAMEAELVDSQTGKQIGAIVQKQQGSRIPFTNLGEWTAAKQVMDKWAKNLQGNLE
jgi:hypothetical protein